MYRTERLRLAPIGSRHASELREPHQDGGIARWYAGRWSREQALRFAEAMESSWRDRGVGKWLAYADSGDAPIGRGGLSLAVVEGTEHAEIGWALRRAVWGRGYATESGRAGLDYAFSVLGVDQIVSFTEVHNARSRAVMERLGMRYVRRILRPGLIAGSAGVHEAAPFALYRIDRPAHDSSSYGNAQRRPSARWAPAARGPVSPVDWLVSDLSPTVRQPCVDGLVSRCRT